MSLGGATREMLEWLAPEASFGRRMLLGNLWLTAIEGRAVVNSRAVFRFLPIVAGPEVVGMAHGTNERLAVEGLTGAIRYFAQLIRDTDRSP